MGVYARIDSRYWWVWLETKPPRRFCTKIPIGATAQARRESRADAELAYIAAMGDVARGVFKLPGTRPARTFREQAEWYWMHVAQHHRGGRREHSILKALTAHFGDTALDAMTAAAIEEWKTTRAATKNPHSVNRELDVLKPMLRSAVPTYVEHSPADGVKRLRGRKAPITILSESAEAALLSVASPAERAMVLLGLDALLRLGDVRRLRQEHDHGTYLDVVDPKTSPYKVPVSTRLRAALDVLQPKDGYYFPRRYAGAWAPMGEATAFHLFKALCERAGVPTGRKVGGITFHGLRHTGATRAARVVKLTVVKELGGWKSLKQLERYDHPDDPEKLRAVEAIGSRPTHGTDERRKNPPKKRRVS